MKYEKEEMREHGKPVQAKAMGESRSFGPVGNDSPHNVMRMGGDDPRRPQANIVIERVVSNHDQSGFNHAYSPQSDSYAKEAERKAMGKGNPMPDGTYES